MPHTADLQREVKQLKESDFISVLTASLQSRLKHHKSNEELGNAAYYILLGSILYSTGHHIILYTNYMMGTFCFTCRAKGKLSQRFRFTGSTGEKGSDGES
jgi:hypothetical protein